MKTKSQLKIVCLGGGVGTVQLLRGLRDYSQNITVVCSMADDGASGGRLRRLYSIPPPGDLINCLAALSDSEPILQKLLTYRFPGNRWGEDHSLGGQKLGNLMLVALTKILGNFNLALATLERIFNARGKILPATCENVSIWAKTTDGKIVSGEENIDLGKYNGARSLAHVYLKPQKITAPEEVKVALRQADVIIAGPGDLYTTTLPVLLVPEIKKVLVKSSAAKIFVVNVANKPFETPNYTVTDYLAALKRHLGEFFFNTVLVNNNFKPRLPQKLNYQYVKNSHASTLPKRIKIIEEDLIEEKFPLYHHPQKLARAVLNVVKFEK